MMQRIYDERTIYKKRMLAAKQNLEDATTSAETLALQKDVSKFNNIQNGKKNPTQTPLNGAIGKSILQVYNLQMLKQYSIGTSKHPMD